MRAIHEGGRPDEKKKENKVTKVWQISLLTKKRFEEIRMKHVNYRFYIYRTWEIIPDEMHFGMIAWPSTSLRPERLWRSCGPALKVWSRCSTRDCLSWVLKKRISSSLPSKQLASEPTNSLSPPPNSCRRVFGRCTSSAALSRLRANGVKVIRLYDLSHFH